MGVTSPVPLPSSPPLQCTCMDQVAAEGAHSTAINLASVVVFCSVVMTMWSFLAVPEDRAGFTKMVPFDIALGTLYAVVCLLELLYFFGMYRQTPKLVGLSAWASVGVSVIVLAAGTMWFVLQFSLEDFLVDQCITEITGITAVVRGNSWRLASIKTTLSAEDARDWCNHTLGNNWTHHLLLILFSSAASIGSAGITFVYWGALLHPAFIDSPRETK